ncbi:MAG: hypothetical protein JXA10_08115 [Anaerolineae bacterium]|nr:hypothetical protein [Anaerolineae bacterium]
MIDSPVSSLNVPADSSDSFPARWPRWALRIGLVWCAVLLIMMGLQEGASPEDQTTALSITLSGVYTLLLAWTRRWWLSRLLDHPLRNAILVGSINAAVIETLFLIVEKAFGAEGVAAHPNLILDLVITMPWYIGMVIIFVRVQNRQRFIPALVLLLGGLYEIGGDGIAGGVFSGSIFTPWVLILYPGVMLWLFIPVYSSMVLPPAWIIAQTPPPPKPAAIPAWKDALRPLVWLVPFMIYLVIVLLVAGALSEIV